MHGAIAVVLELALLPGFFQPPQFDGHREVTLGGIHLTSEQNHFLARCEAASPPHAPSPWQRQ